MINSILKRSAIALGTAVIVATLTKLGVVDKVSEELATQARKVYKLTGE